jgi:ABC-type bacteriocin/lantibiotic exporter with double-glycine peptidase domain
MNIILNYHIIVMEKRKDVRQLIIEAAENTIVEKENPEKLTFEKQIKYNNVWFKYNGDWVIKGINLRIQKRKTIT